MRHGYGRCLGNETEPGGRYVVLCNPGDATSRVGASRGLRLSSTLQTQRGSSGRKVRVQAPNFFADVRQAVVAAKLVYFR